MRMNKGSLVFISSVIEYKKNNNVQNAIEKGMV